MPMTAMIRNLGKMSSIGLLAPLSDETNLVCERLRDQDRLKKARVHPFSILLALKQYKARRGDKGKLTWEPEPTVVNALDDAFYLAFKVYEFDYQVFCSKRHSCIIKLHSTSRLDVTSQRISTCAPAFSTVPFCSQARIFQ